MMILNQPNLKFIKLLIVLLSFFPLQASLAHFKKNKPQQLQIVKKDPPQNLWGITVNSPYGEQNPYWWSGNSKALDLSSKLAIQEWPLPPKLRDNTPRKLYFYRLTNTKTDEIMHQPILVGSKSFPPTPPFQFKVSAQQDNTKGIHGFFRTTPLDEWKILAFWKNPPHQGGVFAGEFVTDFEENAFHIPKSALTKCTETRGTPPCRLYLYGALKNDPTESLQNVFSHPFHIGETAFELVASNEKTEVLKKNIHAIDLTGFKKRWVSQIELELMGINIGAEAIALEKIVGQNRTIILKSWQELNVKDFQNGIGKSLVSKELPNKIYCTNKPIQFNKNTKILIDSLQTGKGEAFSKCYIRLEKP